MHAFKRYFYNFNGRGDKREVAKLKRKFLSKYHPWIRQVFIAVENLINSIDIEDGQVLTTAEVNYFGKVLEEMYAHECETEIDGMLVAITKLTKLQVRYWGRLNKALA